MHATALDTFAQPERRLARPGRGRRGRASSGGARAAGTSTTDAGRGARPPDHRDGRDGRRRCSTRRSPPAPTGSSSPRPGAGNTDPALLAAAERAMAAGPAGRAGHALPGGPGRRPPTRSRAAARPGSGPGRCRSATSARLKARVALALGLGRRPRPRRAGGAPRRPAYPDADAARHPHHRPDRDARRRRRVRLGRGDRDPRRARRVRRHRRSSSRRGRTRSPNGSPSSPTRSRSRASPTRTSTSPRAAAGDRQVDLSDAATLADGLERIRAAHDAAGRSRMPGSRATAGTSIAGAAGRRPTTSRRVAPGRRCRALGARPPRAAGEPAPRSRRPASTRDTPDPPGGVIRRDADGDPEGVLYEAAARLVTGHIPPMAPSDLEAASSRSRSSCSRSASSPSTIRAGSRRTPTSTGRIPAYARLAETRPAAAPGPCLAARRRARRGDCAGGLRSGDLARRRIPTGGPGSAG